MRFLGNLVTRSLVGSWRDGLDRLKANALRSVDDVCIDVATPSRTWEKTPQTNMRGPDVISSCLKAKPHVTKNLCQHGYGLNESSKPCHADVPKNTVGSRKRPARTFLVHLAGGHRRPIEEELLNLPLARSISPQTNPRVATNANKSAGHKSGSLC